MRILKSGETGWGGLIEWDAGFINPNQKDNKLILEQMAEAIKNPTPPYAPYPFYMYAVLQKAGIENKNGRIYPFDVLDPEIQKYLTLIPDRSTSEYNHPECVDDQVDTLTNDGWKKVKDINVGDLILTYNSETKTSEYKLVDKKIDQPYKGKMIYFKGRNIDVQTTPNHKFWIINKNSNIGKFITAQEIFNGGSELSSWYIPKSSIYLGGIDYKTFKLSGIKTNIPNKGINDTYNTDIEINAIVWFRFLGFYLSEGHSSGVNTGKRSSFRVVITQKNVEKINIIREILSQLPFDFHENTRKNGTKDFSIYDARLHSYLAKLGDSHSKYIPQEIKNADPKLLNELFDCFKMGDGRTIGQIYTQSDVFSTSEQLINDLHEILIKIGGNGKIKKEERNKDRYIKNNDGTLRLIEGKNTKPIYFLTIAKTNNIWLDKRFLQVGEVDFDGRVYCVTVPNHIFYIRSNGKSCWTGNSSIIDLERISHRLVKVWWEDKVLMGQLEILTSPAFRHHGQISCKGDHAALLLSYGITLGISSRGVGSLKNEHGKNIVQSDFELICFDLVSSPSTPGAYLFNDINAKDNLPEMIKNRKDELITESNIKLIEQLNEFLL